MWLVVAGRVERELPDQRAVLGDHPDLQTIDEHQDPRGGNRGSEAAV